MSKVTETASPAVTTESKAATQPASPEPKSYLVAFLFSMCFGILALRNFYTGDKRTGWIRVGFLLGYIVFLALGAATGQAALMIIGGALGFAAMVWAVVDFFYVYFTVKTDASGQALAATPRDKKWARNLFWTTIAFAILYLIAIAVLAAIGQNELQKDPSLWRDLESDSQLQQDYNFN